MDSIEVGSSNRNTIGRWSNFLERLKGKKTKFMQFRITYIIIGLWINTSLNFGK